MDERNARYEALVLSHKVADGGYISRPTQTIHNPQKNQNDMAAPSTLREFGVQVHCYDFKRNAFVVLYCAVLCCAVLCCAVLCCTVLYCAVLCCAVLCCAVQHIKN